MVARNADNPWGLWHRAFALTLAGRHKDALADLATAAEKSALKEAPKAPAWVDLFDATARCDSNRLAVAAKEGSHAKLAMLLRMTTLEFPRQTAVALQVAKDVVALDAECFRAQDSMCEYRGVSTQHMTTVLGPQVLAQMLPDKIRSLLTPPASAKKRLEGAPSATLLAEALDRAGDVSDDRGEPSWGALAHFIRETRFVHVWRRLTFLKVMLGVPVGDYWNEVILDVAGHRYRPYLDTLVLPPQESTKLFAEFVDQIDLTYISGNETELITALLRSRRPKGNVAWEIAQAHDDETAKDIAGTLAITAEENKPLLARDLLAISPHMPYARAALLQHDWDNTKNQAEAWEKESGDSHAVLAALASRYSSEKRFDDAQRVLDRYIKQFPDVWAYQQLATNFKAQGQIDRWQKTLDDYLANVHDLGLDHAKVRVEIANHFMGMSQWEKAKPYAEDAAQTWAQWAMDCAARCAEGEQDWERAEAWYSRSTARYPSWCWADWYLFCKRTGHGNLDAARDFANEYITANAERPDLVFPEYAGTYHWLEGRVEKAKAAFAEAYEKRTSISAALSLAQIADDEKDTARRDQILKELCTKHREEAPRSIAICQLFLDTLFAPGGKKPLDLASLKRQVDDFPEIGRGNAQFFVGWFLKNHNEQDAGKANLRSCSESKHSLVWYKVLAAEVLKQLAGE